MERRHSGNYWPKIEKIKEIPHKEIVPLVHIQGRPAMSEIAEYKRRSVARAQLETKQEGTNIAKDLMDSARRDKQLLDDWDKKKK